MPLSVVVFLIPGDCLTSAQLLTASPESHRAWWLLPPQKVSHVTGKWENTRVPNTESSKIQRTSTQEGILKLNPATGYLCKTTLSPSPWNPVLEGLDSHWKGFGLKRGLIEVLTFLGHFQKDRRAQWGGMHVRNPSRIWQGRLLAQGRRPDVSKANGAVH